MEPISLFSTGTSIVNSLSRLLPFLRYFKKKFHIQFDLEDRTSITTFGDYGWQDIGGGTSHIVIVSLLVQELHFINRLSILDANKKEFILWEPRRGSGGKKIDAGSPSLELNVSIPEEVNRPIRYIVVETIAGKKHYSKKHPKLPETE